MTHRERHIVEGRYLKDILDQPRALTATLERLHIPKELAAIKEELQDGRLKSIVLTGMGSSFHILNSISISLLTCGYHVIAVETSELIHYLPSLLNHECLVIAVSQSGQSAETIGLLEKNAGRAKVLAVTNNPLSPLASSSDVVVLTHAGEEFSVSSKTYVASLCVLQTVAAYLCNESFDAIQRDLLEVVPMAAAYFENWRQHVLEMASYLDGMRHLFFVGRGVSLAAAATGALITKEAVGIHAEAMSSASFRHGPMEMLNDSTFVGVLEGAPATRDLNRHLVRDIENMSGRARLIGIHAEAPSLRIERSSAKAAPILEIFPLQLATIALGYLSGTEAGVFKRATKVTSTE